MPKTIKPASSSVIVGYELLKQTMELETDKQHLAKIDQIQRKRRIKKSKKDEDEPQNAAVNVKDIDMHKISFPEFYQRLHIDENVAKNGLSQSEAVKRNLEQGDNMLTEKKSDPWYFQLLHEVTSFFSLLLWGGAILCFIAYGIDQTDPSNLYLGIVLVFVVIVTSIVTFL